MKLRKSLAALALTVAVLPLAACGTSTTDTAAAGSSSVSTTTTTAASTNAVTGTAPTGQGPGGGVDVSAVTTETQLIALVQDAYGDASLDRHRGHRPVEDVLDAVLTISHEELHVRMDQGQNLAAVAEDLGIDPQTLIDALVASRTAAVDAVLAAGEITESEAEQYRKALETAFSFRVTWNGSDATPTFTGI